MRNIITTNTHHAFLNTEIVFQCEEKVSDLVDDLTNKNYVIDNGCLAIRLCAGKHRFYSQEKDSEVNIIIEDAIKLGGGQITKVFIFDDNYWVFVETDDRLYIANTQTNEEKVEYNLKPEEIISFEPLYGKNCNYFLFQTKNSYSIYDVETGEEECSFSNHIYSNSHLVIYQEEGLIKVYNYRNKRIVTEFTGQYAFGNKFYFVKDSILYGLNLSSCCINKIDSVGKLDGYYLLKSNWLLKLEKDYTNSKEYFYYTLGNGEKYISRTKLLFPYYIANWGGKDTIEYLHLCDLLKQRAQDVQELTHLGLEVNAPGIFISEITHKWIGKDLTTILYGNVISQSKRNLEPHFKITENVQEKSISFSDAVIDINPESEKETKINHDTQSKETEVSLNDGEKLLGVSTSGKYIVVKIKDGIVIRNTIDNTTSNILTNVLDITNYYSAYFTSDGKNVVFEDCNKSFKIMGFEDFIQKPFDIEGSTISRVSGYNGYKPEVIFDVSNKQLPVWRDPITLKRVTKENMSDCVYLSPDEQYIANTRIKTVYYNNLNDKEINAAEYRDYVSKYNIDLSTSDEDRKLIIEKRKDLIKQYGEGRVFKNLYEYNKNSLSNDAHISQNDLNGRLKEKNQRTSYIWINQSHQFTDLFIDELAYITYQKKESSDKKHLLIGKNVWFLNYVSFSFDSHYLAFGAKLKDNVWRHSLAGIFELYDLYTEQIVCRREDILDNNLCAVWMTMFNKKGDVAFYDSIPNTYYIPAEGNYSTNIKISGKSLLCFSPSGNYIALSNQSYIDHTHHLDNPLWGHQLSGNVFIYDTNQLNECIAHFNDFGKGIKGVSFAAGHVASAAFSSDETKLLAVGDDGVIVIRNLHLKDNDQDTHTDYNKVAEFLDNYSGECASNVQFNKGFCFNKNYYLCWLMSYMRSQDSINLEEAHKSDEQVEASDLWMHGLKYLLGIGFPENKQVAIEWFIKSAEQGYSEGQFHLGCMYKDGILIQRDNAKSIEWIRKSADRGYPLALFQLGYMHKFGKGVPQDDAIAMDCFCKLNERVRNIKDSGKIDLDMHSLDWLLSKIDIKR